MFSRLSTTERLAYAGIACLIVGGAAYVGFARTEKPAAVTFDNQTTSTPAKPEAAVSEVVVHVTGAVNKPGVYRLPAGSRIDDALKSAGGTKPDAEMEEWNLAAKLIDASQIVIRTKQAVRVASAKATPHAMRPPRLTGTVPPVHVDVPKAYQGGPSAPNPYTGTLAVQPEEPTKKTTPAERAKKQTPAQGSIDLNSATAEEFQKLPGVGPSTAAKIIDYRNAHGRFSSVEELLGVKGIGPKKLDAIRDYLRV